MPSKNLWSLGKIQSKNKNPMECATASFKRRRQSSSQIAVTYILHQPAVV